LCPGATPYNSKLKYADVRFGSVHYKKNTAEQADPLQAQNQRNGKLQLMAIVAHFFNTVYV